jgi:hypothetical protein
VIGDTKGALRRQSTQERRAVLASQQMKSTQWTTHLGAFIPSITEGIAPQGEYRGGNVGMPCREGQAVDIGGNEGSSRESVAR